MSQTRDQELMTEEFMPVTSSVETSFNGESSPRSGNRMRRLVRRATRRPIVLLVVLMVLSNATLGVLLVRSAGTDEGPAAEAARGFAVSVLSFDYQALDDDVERLKGHTTPRFFRRAGSMLSGDTTFFRDAMTEAEALSSANVLSIDVTSASRSKAVVLVVAEQTVRNRGADSGQTLLRVFEVTVVRTSSGWKADDVTTVGGGPSS